MYWLELTENGDYFENRRKISRYGKRKATMLTKHICSASIEGWLNW